MPVQMRTVEFQVPGVVDGVTPAPELSFDPRSPIYKAADADGIIRFTPAEMIDRTGGNLGLFDPDFLMGGTFADRFLQLLEVVTAGVAAIAGIQIVDSEGNVEQQEIVLGPEGVYYERDLILVPQGSAVRFSGYTPTPAQPVVIRISVVAFTSVEDYAELRQIACCSGGSAIPPGGDNGPTYVYRPGGVAGENVYTDFPTLTAALALRAGPKWVEVDDSFVAIPPIPAGVWDVNSAIFQGLAGADQTLLRGLPGARLTNLSRIQGTLQLQNADPAGATMVLAANDVFDVADGASLASIAGQPVADVPGVGAAILRLYASELANLGGLGPAVSVSGGAGSSLVIQLWEGSAVANDTISSAVGSIVTAQIRSSAAGFSRDQTPLLGGLAFTYFVPDEQAPATAAGGTLPVLGYVNATGTPVVLPLATQSAGPIFVRNRLAVALEISAGVGNTINGLASILIAPGADVTLKSNGLLAWFGTSLLPDISPVWGTFPLATLSGFGSSDGLTDQAWAFDTTNKRLVQAVEVEAGDSTWFQPGLAYRDYIESLNHWTQWQIMAGDYVIVSGDGGAATTFDAAATALADAAHPGVAIYSITAAANSRSGSREAGGVSGGGIRLGTFDFTSEVLAQHSVKPEVADLFEIYLCSMDGVGQLNAPTAGCFFVLNSTSGNWIARTRVGAGVPTDVDTLVDGTINTWRRFKVVATSAVARFYIDDALVATILTTLPTGQLLPCSTWMLRTAAGGGAVNLAVDYNYWRQNLR